MRTSLPGLLSHQIWRSNRQAKIETQLIHQIGSLFIITLEDKKTLSEREVGIATILGIFLRWTNQITLETKRTPRVKR